MDALDDSYENTGGDTPDHIIVSRAVWRDMKTKSRFEKIGSTDIPKRRPGIYGFMGMRVWQSGALDEHDDEFMLLSEEMFDAMFPVTRDWRESKGF